jgi:hypothetical protein
MALGDGPFAAAYSHPAGAGPDRRYLRERGIVPMAYADTAGAAAYRRRNRAIRRPAPSRRTSPPSFTA